MASLKLRGSPPIPPKRCEDRLFWPLGWSLRGPKAAWGRLRGVTGHRIRFQRSSTARRHETRQEGSAGASGSELGLAGKGAAFCAISHEKHLFQALFQAFLGHRPSECRLFCLLQAWILEGGNKQTHLLFRPPPKGSQVEQLHVGRGEGNGAVQKQDETRSSMDHMMI